MKTVTKLEPQAPILKPRKKVAAYARVSMESERLQHSLSAQVSYYNEKIQKNPDWAFAGVYVDDGISGTGTAKRFDFNRMIEDAEAGKIDIILTKSISRFARNTVDLLETVRHLREIGVEVWFERENIHSLSGDGELMLSILASFAQEESRSISDNVKWGTRKRFEQGIPNGHFRVYGYRWEGDDLVIVPEEAAIVKRIFQNFLDGKSRLETEREFEAEGITTRAGCRWEDSNIANVLKNCTYTGDLLLQKEYISDPINKKRKKNRGELPQYLVADHHEAIIDRSTFDYVQQEMARRKELGPLANKSLNITCFTGKVKCGLCGASLMRSTRINRARNPVLGDKIIAWSCGTTRKKGGRCATLDVPERYLQSASAHALGLEEFDPDAFTERVELVTVPEDNKLVFHFKDGTEVTETWENTSKKDSWTPEARARASEYRKAHSGERKSATCFTGFIRCPICGINFRGNTVKRLRAPARFWSCAGSATCHAARLREDTLMQMCADALGLEAFDEVAFKEVADHLEVVGTEITIFLKDGSTRTMTWVKTRKAPPWTEDRRRDLKAKRKEKNHAEGNENPGNGECADGVAD